MRMLAQDGAFYRKPRVDGTEDPEALRRLRIVEGVDRMRERFTAAEAAEAFEVSRATYHEWRRRLWKGGVKGLFPRSSRPRTHRGRRWTAADARRVLRLQRGMPWAGKARIAPALAGRWPAHALSEATVGRILRRMVARGRRCRARSARPVTRAMRSLFLDYEVRADKVNGYPAFVWENGMHVFFHEFNWLRAHNLWAKPWRRETMHIHHVNGDKLDCRPKNLVLLTEREHDALHSRKG